MFVRDVIFLDIEYINSQMCRILGFPEIEPGPDGLVKVTRSLIEQLCPVGGVSGGGGDDDDDVQYDVDQVMGCMAAVGIGIPYVDAIGTDTKKTQKGFFDKVIRNLLVREEGDSKKDVECDQLVMLVPYLFPHSPPSPFLEEVEQCRTDPHIRINFRGKWTTVLSEQSESRLMGSIEEINSQILCSMMESCGRHSYVVPISFMSATWHLVLPHLDDESARNDDDEFADGILDITGNVITVLIKSVESKKGWTWRKVIKWLTKMIIDIVSVRMPGLDPTASLCCPCCEERGCMAAPRIFDEDELVVFCGYGIKDLTCDKCEGKFDLLEGLIMEIQRPNSWNDCGQSLSVFFQNVQVVLGTILTWSSDERIVHKLRLKNLESWLHSHGLTSKKVSFLFVCVCF